jgi:small GTP-binding protein
MARRQPLGWLRNSKSVVLLGLDEAGKTTLVNYWTKGTSEKTKTTIGLDVEHVEFSNEVFNLIDLGGQKAFRLTLWKTYAKMAKGVIFVFDITNRERTKEAVDWFWKIAEWLTKEIPIIFCANKIDLKKSEKSNCMNLQEIIKTFKLDKFSKKAYRQHSFQIFEISAKTGENVDQAMGWLFDRLKEEQHKPILRTIHVLAPKFDERLDITFQEDSITDEERKEIQRLIDLNCSILSENQSSVQMFKLKKADALIMARSDFICIAIAEKGSDSSDLRLVADAILSMFISQYEEEGTIDNDLLKNVIIENFAPH